MKPIIQKHENAPRRVKNKQVKTQFIDNRPEAFNQQHFQSIADRSNLSSYSSVVQRQIDPVEESTNNKNDYAPGYFNLKREKGEAFIGKYVRSNDGAMGRIVSYFASTNVYCIELQKGESKFDSEIDKEKGDVYALGTDPYWRIISNESWGYLSEFGRRSRPKGMMTLKTFHLQEKEIINYRMENGIMIGNDDLPLNPPKKVAFVITQNLELIIGNGHTGLSGGNAVIMAGMLEIVDGKANYAGNESGHYFPEGLEEVRGVKYLRRHFPWVRVTKSNFGKWLFEERTSKDSEPRNEMIEILEEGDKEKRRGLKDQWHEKYSRSH